MLGFSHVTTCVVAPEGYLVGLSDLVWINTDVGPRLYAVSARGGGVIVLDPNAGLEVLGSVAFPTRSSQLDAPRVLMPTLVNGQPALIGVGQANSSIDLFSLDANGLLGRASHLRMQGEGVNVHGQITAIEAISVEGAGGFVLASRLVNGLQVWRDVGNNRLERVNQGSDAEILGQGQVGAMTMLDTPEGRLVLALGAEGQGLLAYRLSSDGLLTLRSRLTAEDGLAVSGGTVLETVTLAGETFVIIGAAGSGSVSVAAIQADGQLNLVDHILDERHTRFGGVTEMATLTVNGQVFIVAAGADDGLSLFTMLPGGRLVHLGSAVLTGTEALRAPGGLALSYANDQLHVFVAGISDGAPQGSGISHLTVNLGPIGEIISGGLAGGLLTGTSGRDILIGLAGPDVIVGGASGDILIDGAGADTLTGGLGADLFILSADGAVDSITDFERGVDRLDLSAWGRFYSADALTITPTARGAEIRYGQEVLIITTRDGRTLTARDLPIEHLRDLTHLVSVIDPPPLVSAQDGVTYGSAGNDMVFGGAGNDTLFGDAGDDRLYGDAFVSATAMDHARSVYRLYQATLDRAPDPAGLNGWTEMLAMGTQTLSQVASGFVNSAEFQATYGGLTNGAFVTLLYNNVLNRAPDPAGLAGWTDLLNGGMSRQDVVLGFSQSLEFRNATDTPAARYVNDRDAAQWSDDVFRLYQATLDRNPDPAGFTGWTGLLAGGTSFLTAVTGFVNSTEFQSTYGALDNTQFVTLLYNNVLNRAPDAGGLAAWTTAMTNGMSRAEVVQGFSQSAEFINNTASALHDWIRDLGSGNMLVGGRGNDTLFGGILADTFVFQSGDGGHDVVHGFQAWDWVDMIGFGFGSGDDICAHMSQVGLDVVFADGDVSVRFVGTELSLFTDDVFIF